MIGRMKNWEEAEKYVTDKLVTVKEVLDDIADKTGIVFLCFSADAAEKFCEVGGMLSRQMISILKVMPERVVLANKAREFAASEGANDVPEEKDAQQ